MSSSQYLPEQKLDSGEFFFNRICDAAIKQDENTINTLLTKVCIDLRAPRLKGGQDTPVSYLATKGDKVAVRFLLTRFSASSRWAVYGYARGGYFREAEEIVDFASNLLEQIALLRWMIRGAACGKYAKKVDEIIMLYPFAQRDLWEAALAGFTLGGDLEQADKIIKLALINGASLETKNDLLGIVTRNCALGGEMGEADKIVKSATNPAERLAFLKEMASGAATNGHFQNSNMVLKQASNVTEEPILIGVMIMGHGQNGQVQNIKSILGSISDELIKNLASKHSVCAYAHGGYLEEAEKQPIEPDYKVCGYFYGGHFIHAYKGLDLMSQSSNDRERIIVMRLVISMCAIEGYLNHVNHILNVAKTPAERSDLLKHLAVALIKVRVHSIPALALQTLAAFKPADQIILVTELKKIMREKSKPPKINGIISFFKTFFPSESSFKRNLAVSGKNLYFLTTNGPLKTCPDYLKSPFGAAWLELEVRQCLLMMPLFSLAGKKIPDSLFLFIIKYLLPSPLSQKSIIDLSNRIFAHYRPNRFTLFCSVFTEKKEHPLRSKTNIVSILNKKIEFADKPSSEGLEPVFSLCIDQQWILPNDECVTPGKLIP